MAKFKKIIKKNSEKVLIKTFIKLFLQLANKKEKLKKRFSFVLTGGASPINLYKELSKIDINWKNIDFFWGDERFVSTKSKDSNYNLANKYLLKKIKVKNKQIYNIKTNKKNILLSAMNYEKKLKSYFKNKKSFFDLILLGMGNDGHIASIFSNNLFEKSNKFVTSIQMSDFARITLTLKLINKSNNIFLWLNDKKKTKIFKSLKYKKKTVPVFCLKKNKTSIFSLYCN